MAKILVPEKMINYTDSEFLAIVGASASTGSAIFKYENLTSFTVFGAGLSLAGEIPTDNLLRKLRAGISQLEKRGLVSELAKGYYIFNNCGDFNEHTDRFILVPIDAVRDILNANIQGIRNISLLHYLGSLLGTFDHKDNICYMPLSYIAKRTEKSLPTVLKYNKVLEDMRVIGVIHGVSDDKLTRHNVYYLPGYFENAREYARSRGWLRTINSKKAI